MVSKRPSPCPPQSRGEGKNAAAGSDAPRRTGGPFRVLGKIAISSHYRLSFTGPTGYLHLQHITPVMEGLVMAHAMIVQLPVTGEFGTDDDFDLRTQLERELGLALTREQAGECGRGEIDNGRMSVHLEHVADPGVTLRVVKDVLARLKQLPRAVVVLETRCEADPDDIDCQTLWPIHHASPVRVA